MADSQNKKYRLGRKLGAGSFGEIYLGHDVESEEQVAVKLERATGRFQQLMYEARVLHKYLKSEYGIPRVRWCGTEGCFNVLVMDLLGPSLEDLFNYCGRRFSLKTSVLLARQMLDRIEQIHRNGFLHRDIKPDNFLIGVGEQASVLYSVDFGLAKRYYDPKSRQHIPFREGKSLTGTARYASVWTHLGHEQSRRDDLEGLCFVLLYLVRGSLPWQGIRARDKTEKYEHIRRRKLAISIEEICTGLPREIATFMTYCRTLCFEAEPDYGYLRGLLQRLCERHSIEDDGMFDWVVQNIRERGRSETEVKAMLKQCRAEHLAIIAKRSGPSGLAKPRSHLGGSDSDSSAASSPHRGSSGGGTTPASTMTAAASVAAAEPSRQSVGGPAVGCHPAGDDDGERLRRNRLATEAAGGGGGPASKAPPAKESKGGAVPPSGRLAQGGGRTAGGDGGSARVQAVEMPRSPMRQRRDTPVPLRSGLVAGGGKGGIFPPVGGMAARSPAGVSSAQATLASNSRGCRTPATPANGSVPGSPCRPIRSGVPQSPVSRGLKAWGGPQARLAGEAASMNEGEEAAEQATANPAAEASGSAQQLDQMRPQPLQCALPGAADATDADEALGHADEVMVVQSPARRHRRHPGALRIA